MIPAFSKTFLDVGVRRPDGRLESLNTGGWIEFSFGGVFQIIWGGMRSMTTAERVRDFHLQRMFGPTGLPPVRIAPRLTGRLPCR